MSRTFVFRMSWGQFEGTAIIKYTQADLDIMQECIDKEKAYGTVFIATSQRTGNPPYAYIAPKLENRTEIEVPKKDKQEDQPDLLLSEENGTDCIVDTEDELPF